MTEPSGKRSGPEPAGASRSGRLEGRPGQAAEPGKSAQRPPRKPRLLPTALASVACFLVVFEFLAFQLRSGNDPALGAQPIAAQAPKRPTVLNRKVVQTRVVHLPPRQQVSSSAAPVPTGTASAVAAAPAPAPAAAPAPAPAPAPAAAPAPAPAPAASPAAAPVTSSS